MKTVLQLKTEIRGSIWASGEAENLVSQHDDQFQEAFAEISKYAICERDDNVNVIPFCNTFYKMGMTVIPRPRGIINRIFTIANSNFDDPVFIRQVEWPGPEAWARNLYLFPQPILTALPALPIGFQYSSVDNDSLYGRARTGIWAIFQDNIFIAPWIQSNELVVIEWKGIKDKWEDNDLINPAIHYKKAVKLYVQYAHERDFGVAERAMLFHNPGSHMGLYDEALGDVIHECDLQMRVQDMPSTGSRDERGRLCAELADDFPPTTKDGIILADIGNAAAAGDDLTDVEATVRSFGANSILASNFIAGALVDYDVTAGSSYHDFMMPYPGVHGQGAKVKALFPAPSAADWTKDSLATFITFFGTPNNGRYYDVVLGDVHLFVIDTGVADPDGITSGGTQGAWLQAQLALSTAPWKVVKMYHAPYGTLNSNVTLQWPFKLWGAHLVLCSQSVTYERLDISGLPVINNGLGGLSPIVPIATPSVSTVASYAGRFGAGKISANLTGLIYEFVNVDGEVIDTLKLSK